MRKRPVLCFLFAIALVGLACSPDVLSFVGETEPHSSIQPSSTIVAQAKHYPPIDHKSQAPPVRHETLAPKVDHDAMAPKVDHDALRGGFQPGAPALPGADGMAPAPPLPDPSPLPHEPPADPAEEHSTWRDTLWNIANGIAQAGATAWEGVKSVTSAVWEGVKWLGSGVAWAASGLWEGIKWTGSALAWVASTIWEGVKWGWNSFAGWVSENWDELKWWLAATGLAIVAILTIKFWGGAAALAAIGKALTALVVKLKKYKFIQWLMRSSGHLGWITNPIKKVIELIIKTKWGAAVANYLFSWPKYYLTKLLTMLGLKIKTTVAYWLASFASTANDIWSFIKWTFGYDKPKGEKPSSSGRF